MSESQVRKTNQPSLGMAGRWSVDSLETEVINARDARSEAIVSIIMLIFFALLPLVPTAFLYVGHLNDGGPFVNQALWNFWLPTYYALIGLSALLHVWTIARGRLSKVRIVLRGALNVVFGAFLTALFLTQEVLDPAIDSGIIQASGASDWVDVLYIVVIWGVVVWDLFVCVKYWRSVRSIT